MPNMPTSHLQELRQLRQLFAEAAPTDLPTITSYGWIIAKCLNHEHEQLGSIDCRQLLLEYLRLPLERPSRLHSAILSAAVKVAGTYPDFRFAAFLRMWGIENLRPEDHERQQATVPAGSPAGPLPVSSSFAAGKSFPSLAEKTASTLAHSLLLHPEDRPVLELPEFEPLLSALRKKGYLLSASTQQPSSSLSLTHPLLVTRIKQSVGKDGRKYTFVTLTSPEGLEIECVSHALQPSPLHPLPEGKRHYVNIGQLYDCLLRQKPAPASVGSPSDPKATVPATSSSAQAATVPSELSLVLKEAYLSTRKPTEVFPTAIGYLEAIDQQHGHMHIYDSHSRHFVAPVQRFSRERVGDFVRFIPIIPATSKFKTAIIQGTIPASSLSATVPSDSSEGQPLLREIRITHINQEKGYAAWELTDPEHPITELLSPLQLSLGETSPTFTTGYLNLPHVSESCALGSPTTVPAGSPAGINATVPAGSPSGISLGQTLRAFIYLRRGKDRQKRPHVARLFS